MRYNDPKMAYVILYFVVIFTGVLEAGSLFHGETIYAGYDNIVNPRILENCHDLYDSMNRGMLSWYLVCASDSLGSPRALPFLFSIALIPLSFLLGKAATKSATVGIVTAAGLALNPIFLLFNDSSAFHQFWAVFITASMYMAYRKPILAGPLLFLAVAAKPIAILFVPALIIMCWNDRRGVVSVGFATTLICGYTIFGGIELIQGQVTTFVPLAESMSWSLTKHTGIYLLLALSASVGYGFVCKDRIAFALAASLVAYSLTDMMTTAVIFPYHLMPIVILMNMQLALAVSRTSHTLKRMKLINRLYGRFAKQLSRDNHHSAEMAEELVEGAKRD